MVGSRIGTLTPGLSQCAGQIAAVLEPWDKKSLRLMKRLKNLSLHILRTPAETAEAAGNVLLRNRIPVPRRPAEQMQAHGFIRALIAEITAGTENRQKIKTQSPQKNSRASFEGINPNHFPAMIFPGRIPDICTITGKSGKFRGNDCRKEILKLMSRHLIHGR